MKLTKQQLKQAIKKELGTMLKEAGSPPPMPQDRPWGTEPRQEDMAISGLLTILNNLRRDDPRAAETQVRQLLQKLGHQEDPSVVVGGGAADPSVQTDLRLEELNALKEWDADSQGTPEQQNVIAQIEELATAIEAMGDSDPQVLTDWYLFLFRAVKESYGPLHGLMSLMEGVVRVSKTKLVNVIAEETDLVLKETFIAVLEEELGRSLTEKELDEITRRDFLRAGVGGAAGIAAATALPRLAHAPTGEGGAGEAEAAAALVDGADLTHLGSFNSAFAAAQDAGLNTFKWKGSMYTTEEAAEADEPEASEEEEIDLLKKIRQDPGYAYSTGKVPRHYPPQQRGIMYKGVPD